MEIFLAPSEMLSPLVSLEMAMVEIEKVVLMVKNQVVAAPSEMVLAFGEVLIVVVVGAMQVELVLLLLD